MKLPPTTFPDDSTRTPSWEFPMAAVPVWSVPIRLPTTWFPVAPPPVIHTPLAQLPMTVGTPRTDPPIVLFGEPVTRTPAPVLPAPVVPVGSTPTKSPRTWLP